MTINVNDSVVIARPVAEVAAVEPHGIFRFLTPVMPAGIHGR